ncbi:MAG: flagellar motor protein MotB, partial [Planctomycetota bacterium]
FGHTDDTPIRKSGWKDNYELSAQRALAVVRYLGSKGIDFKRLIACACGEHRPRVPNRSAAERARNRRVEIFAVDPL